eukprot:CAMPEP_0184482844 /NCGR_PEP_ID=MMETSP0113_2-20130426/4437_1 /TAXON_ID=91329 /ORGANISM="Norrisiella sphaerica, Strain BC52" /LENGTH=90 /DNA_ID=CAMNT_0026862847 /DNA_START=23 /DNA_END=295 /DNA_ORIENTATION=-
MAESADKKTPLDGPENSEAAKEAGAISGPSNNLEALPIRQYLDQTVTPVLLKAMGELVHIRPEDPVEWLAAWLVKNNPNKKVKAESSPEN